MQDELSKPLKIYGILTLAFSVLAIPTMVRAILGIIWLVTDPQAMAVVDVSTQALALDGVLIAALAALVAQSIVLGVRLIRDKRRGAAAQANAIIANLVVIIILIVMVVGFKPWLLAPAAHLIFFIVVSSYFDPSLREERQLQRHLQALQDKSDAEDGTLGLDKTGRGYITLNFFNVFWIFVASCVIGDLFETVYYAALHDGEVINRTGMLWGQFSPIYGFGATLMTVSLNRFYRKSPLIIYGVSALIGGAFEYLVSWFFQFAFGITAWDYSGAPFNIDGRTDLFHILAWGLLGLFWIKVCLPWLLKLINRIPWNWRYGVTVAFTVFMVVNGGLTMFSFDCWYQREAGVDPHTAISDFCAEHWGNDFMAEHFQTMSMDTSKATRS